MVLSLSSWTPLWKFQAKLKTRINPRIAPTQQVPGWKAVAGLLLQWAAYDQHLETLDLQVLLSMEQQLTRALPMTCHMTLACSVRTSATEFVATGLHLDLQGIAHHLNPYRLPPAPLILSKILGTLLHGTCLHALLDHPWDNAFPSHLAGVACRAQEFLCSSQCPCQCSHARTRIPAAWLHYHPLPSGPRYPSTGVARSPGAHLTGGWNLLTHLTAHLGAWTR